MSKSKLVILPMLLALILFVGFFYGFLVGHDQIFPFEILSDINKSLNTKSYDSPEPRLQIYQDLSSIDELISIKTYTDIVNKRQLLIDYIWVDNNFPSEKYPKYYKSDIKDESFNDMNNLKRIDSFTVEMDYGMNSISYLFLANNSNNKLIIYHQGHDSRSIGGFDNHSFEEDYRIIQYFLDRNFSVLIFSMVGQGMNNEPVINFDGLGAITMNSHEHFRLLESENFHPIKFFIEPVIVTLNQIQNDYNFESYFMTGKNSGGWTTVIVSAIDTRIEESYSIAGSFPLWMSSDPANYSDYEQNLPDFYRIANYLELYLLSSYGENRKLVLFYNEFDPCCFPGTLYEKFPFESTIKDKLNLLGNGKFDVIIDNGQNKHIISDSVMNKIISSIKKVI